MPLEWEPLPTPKRGYEREFVDLFHKLVTSKGSKREQVMGWFANVSEPAFATIGAPRVGYDAAADEWLRERLETTGRLAELDRVKVEMHGYNVLELMPPCEGFPVYSNHTISEDLDRYSFHAQLLLETRDALGDELFRLAHVMMLPEAHREFAERLFEIADEFASENALPANVATIREPVFPRGTPAHRGHVLYAAAKWCAYWSKRGHGLAVSY